MNRRITAIILAGGRGSRMGGADKGLIDFEGRPLVAHVIERIAPQVAGILISANRNLVIYERFGYPLVSDELSDFQGPLAGIVAAGRRAETGLICVVPCDTPQLPEDLVSRLSGAMEKQDAEIALAHDGGRSQQLCLLFRWGLLADMAHYLDRGERRVISWIESHRWTTADFSDRPESFRNLNRPDHRLS
ncbi:MAG: molybdenum cofactor guanylyltransferase [Gammaproteobacteria bacterium]|nr:molybdenum cofactor guanylyltransferase [Gammaproteobacteria bacterium]MBU1655130.1 molybdenum cofactor guanylyltransferase [Gammaproteobacteria bacterium]MBU1962096.1 molybdenum cofactor guanylyltransferase [Gammaproteobacteria bacterium]